MEFCIITPTAGLERYARLSKWHLVLQHVKDPKYMNFYRSRRDEGDMIILDNGAYEGKALPSLGQYDDMIRYYAPQVAVLPDLFLHPWKETWHAAMYYLDQLAPEYPTTEWLYIPQAERGDLNGFLQSYHEAIQDPRISWLGIPRALSYAITDNPLARVEFARVARKDRPDLRLHAFGMVNGDVHELPYLRHTGVTSIDSSAPVYRGCLGYYIDNPESRKRWDEWGGEVDFNDQFNYPGHHEIIKHNLEACGVNTNPSW